MKLGTKNIRRNRAFRLGLSPLTWMLIARLLGQTKSVKEIEGYIIHLN